MQVLFHSQQFGHASEREIMELRKAKVRQFADTGAEDSLLTLALEQREQLWQAIERLGSECSLLVVDRGIERGIGHIR